MDVDDGRQSCAGDCAQGSRRRRRTSVSVNDDTRETKVYRNVVDLAAAANQKREELIGRGWRPDAASM